jgi:hypothetical protein
MSTNHQKYAIPSKVVKLITLIVFVIVCKTAFAFFQFSPEKAFRQCPPVLQVRRTMSDLPGHLQRWQSSETSLHEQAQQLGIQK